MSERYRRRLAVAALDDGPPARWPEDGPDDGPGARSARVLLFGAYGNGNLGDAAQADAVAGLLGQLLPGPLALAATSWERRAPYPFVGGAVFPPDALLRGELLPRGEGRGALVVIGGGGLLGAPHFPLHAEAWVDWLARQGVPWALLGVGGSAESLAAPGWRAAYRKLLAGAAWVGLRDADTLAAARAINPAATWFPDPILARALLRDAAGTPPAGERTTDAIVIPRTPNGPADVAANRAALDFAATLRRDGRRVLVVGMEEALDRASVGASVGAGVNAGVGGEDVTFVDRWERLAALCGDSRMVVSSRLHGVIAGLAAGCVVHGLLQPKIGDLLGSLGAGEWFAPGGWPLVDPDQSPEAAALFHRAVRPGLARMRARLDGAMAAARVALAASVSRP